MRESVAFRVYTRLPVALQNAVFSLQSLLDRRIRYSSAFRRYLDWLNESQWAGAEEIRRYQDAKLRWIVRHAYATVPFYRELYDRHGIRPEDIQGSADLPALPLVTKQLVREAGPKMRSVMPSGSRVRVVMTSGTTGTPLRIHRTEDSLALQWAVWWRHRARFGLRVDDPFLMIGARVPISAQQSTPPFWREDWINRRVYLSSYHLKAEHMPCIVEMLDRHEFQYYTGYPSAIAQVCDYLLTNRVRLRRPPRVVTTGSDALLPAFEKRIRAALGSRVTDQYGMGEFAGNFARCERGRYHLDYECCAAELLPIQGTDRSSIVLTGWGNPAMPFIRYAVGDHAVMPPPGDRCSCGRASMDVLAIDGRLEDYIYTPDGRRIIGMNQVFEYAVGAQEIQIVQPSLSELDVRIVPGADYDARATEAALSRELRRRLGSVEMHIRYVLVESIPRERNGKFRAVLSAVGDASFSGRTVRSALEKGGAPGRREVLQGGSLVEQGRPDPIRQSGRRSTANAAERRP